MGPKQRECLMKLGTVSVMAGWSQWKQVWKKAGWRKLEQDRKDGRQNQDLRWNSIIRMYTHSF